MAREMSPDEKRCKDCNEMKPREAFHLCTASADGKQKYCRLCQNRRNRESYLRKTISEASTIDISSGEETDDIPDNKGTHLYRGTPIYRGVSLYTHIYRGTRIRVRIYIYIYIYMYMEVSACRDTHIYTHASIRL